MTIKQQRLFDCRLQILMGVAGMFFVPQLHAAALGLPDSTARVGYGMGMARLAVDDPAGSTRDEVVLQPFTLVYSDWLWGGVRQWAELFFQTAELEADARHIGQEVNQYGVRWSAQFNVPMAPVWVPWLGVGVEVTRAEYERRHTEDDEGFLLTSYRDRDDTGVAVVLHAVSEWALARQWDVAAKLERVQSLGGGVDAWSLGAVLLYRY